jgi:hypothetical protein
MPKASVTAAAVGVAMMFSRRVAVCVRNLWPRVRPQGERTMFTDRLSA